MPEPKMYPIEEAVKAQRALRTASGLGPEMFPIQAFVGMISDEVESLRKHGMSDGEIAKIIRASSSIEISPAEIAENYAPPEERHPHGGVAIRFVQSRKLLETFQQCTTAFDRHASKQGTHCLMELFGGAVLKCLALGRSKDPNFATIVRIGQALHQLPSHKRTNSLVQRWRA